MFAGEVMYDDALLFERGRVAIGFEPKQEAAIFVAHFE